MGQFPVTGRQVIHMAIQVAALLNKAIFVHKLSSDYKLALVMGVDHKSLSNYRHGKTLPDARVIAKLCELTGDDPARLLVEVEAERAKTDEARALWMAVLDRMKNTVHAAIFAVVTAVALMAGFPSDSYAAQTSKSALTNLYIVEYLHRWRLAPLVQRFLSWLRRYISPRTKKTRMDHALLTASSAAT